MVYFFSSFLSTYLVDAMTGILNLFYALVGA